MIMEGHVMRYEGYHAHTKGTLKSDNPYADNDEKPYQSIEWEAGWDYASEENLEGGY
jgi:hypothetical protein